MRAGSILSVQSLRSLLETASFDGERYDVTTLLDAPRDGVIAAIRETFDDAAEGDLSLIYITCHGFYRAGMTFSPWRTARCCRRRNWSASCAPSPARSCCSPTAAAAAD